MKENIKRISRIYHEILIGKGNIHNLNFERYDDEIEKYLIYLDYKKHMKLVPHTP